MRRLIYSNVDNVFESVTQSQRLCLEHMQYDPVDQQEACKHSHQWFHDVLIINSLTSKEACKEAVQCGLNANGWKACKHSSCGLCRTWPLLRCTLHSFPYHLTSLFFIFILFKTPRLHLGNNLISPNQNWALINAILPVSINWANTVVNSWRNQQVHLWDGNIVEQPVNGLCRPDWIWKAMGSTMIMINIFPLLLTTRHWDRTYLIVRSGDSKHIADPVGLIQCSVWDRLSPL